MKAVTWLEEHGFTVDHNYVYPETEDEPSLVVIDVADEDCLVSTVKALNAALNKAGLLGVGHEDWTEPLPVVLGMYEEGTAAWIEVEGLEELLA